MLLKHNVFYVIFPRSSLGLQSYELIYTISLALNSRLGKLNSVLNQFICLDNTLGFFCVFFYFAAARQIHSLFCIYKYGGFRLDDDENTTAP